MKDPRALQMQENSIIPHCVVVFTFTVMFVSVHFHICSFEAVVVMDSVQANWTHTS